MQQQKIVRYVLWGTLALLGFSLFSLWQKEHPRGPEVSSAPSFVAEQSASEVPPMVPPKAGIEPVPGVDGGDAVSVETDVFRLKIALKGGDVVVAELKDYPLIAQSDQGVILLDKSAERYYMAQSGLVASTGPDTQVERALLHSAHSSYTMAEGADKLIVPLSWTNSEGIQFRKTFTFHRDRHDVDVEYAIENLSTHPWSGHFYSQIVQKPKTIQSNSGMMGMQTYVGGAVHTAEKPYKKLKYDTLAEKNFSQTLAGGWVAMVEHYFLSAWVYPADQTFKYFSRAASDGQVFLGAVGDSVTVEPGKTRTVGAKLYLGPEQVAPLKALSPGLELTVDYGFLWPISQFLFFLMQKIFQVVGNWGVSIILVTLLVKTVFFQLSSSSYRSMVNMRNLQPKIHALKERCGENKQEFSMAMMELYRKEKVNPLGGCLPMLIQIPVFIALYYVLLESVEFRHAPFMLWIHDLSSHDPFYVLPLFMGITMFVQQKLSPAPPDPIQAKMMLAMPVVFTVLFLQFPAGLVLYWVVNNLLSLAQQWLVIRKHAR